MLTFTALKVAILMPKLPLEQFPECISMGTKLYSYRHGSHYAGEPPSTCHSHTECPPTCARPSWWWLVSMGSSLWALLRQNPGGLPEEKGPI